MARFNVTYKIVTQESAEQGDVDERGFVDENLSLRDAIGAVNATRTSLVDGIECVECDIWPCVEPRWITITNGMEFEMGACESRSLHIPRGVTPSTARRIARLVGARV